MLEVSMGQESLSSTCCNLISVTHSSAIFVADSRTISLSSSPKTGLVVLVSIKSSFLCLHITRLVPPKRKASTSGRQTIPSRFLSSSIPFLFACIEGFSLASFRASIVQDILS